MALPELIPENHVEIYEYFRDFEPNKRIQNYGFTVMHAIYGSQVHYIGNSSDTISEHLEQGGSIIVAPNHQSNVDTPTVAGLVYEETFAPLKGTTIIPAKAEMFEWPFIGKFFPHMLAHPAFRASDFTNNEEGKQLRKEVTDDLINLNVEHINDGGNSAIFVESTRNKTNPSEVQAVKTGIGRIATSIEDPSKLLIVTTGIAYRTQLFAGKIKLRPLVVVEEPFCVEGMRQEKVLSTTHQQLQSAVTQAFDLAA